jgi:hypothetical protein
MFKKKETIKEELMKIEKRENYVDGELKELQFHIRPTRMYSTGYLYLSKAEITELKEKLNKLCI